MLWCGRKELRRVEQVGNVGNGTGQGNAGINRALQREAKQCKVERKMARRGRAEQGLIWSDRAMNCVNVSQQVMFKITLVYI